MATPQSIFSTSAPETPRETAQGGPLRILVINAVITPVNGLINHVTGVISPL